MKNKVYIIHYIDDKKNQLSKNFENIEFMKFWFKKYISSQKFQFIEKQEFNY